MDAQLVTLYDFTLFVCESLMADIDDNDLQQQPSPGVNPPAWILGHLSIVNDMALSMLGQEKRLPEEWHAEFGPGSDPLPQQHDYPTKDELLDGLRETHAAVKAAVEGVDLATLTDANPIAPLAKTLPTQGDLLAHIVSTHMGMHLGHLSNWRRQMGRPPLF